MCRSGLSDTSETFEEESDIANSLSFDIASFSSLANPTVSKILGFDD